jgi:hypothetical protein
MGALDPHSALLDLASIKLELARLSGPLSRNRRGAPSASFVTTDPDLLLRAPDPRFDLGSFEPAPAWLGGHGVTVGASREV